MWGQLIAQAAKAARAAVGCLLAQLADFADKRINLLLLLKNGLVELLHQVLGEAGLDFKVHQTFVYVGVGHSWFYFSVLSRFASSVRSSSSSR